jgi:hypothetical protein
VKRLSEIKRKRGRPPKNESGHVNSQQQPQADEVIAVGADMSRLQNIVSYENKDLTFRGEIKNYNYDNLLKHKQENIIKFMELADYYVDADELVKGIIKGVLVPFSLSCGWKFRGATERTKKKYKEHYDNIGFLDIARNIFFELYTYAQCYVYFMPGGRLITLPPHRIRIADVMAGNEPILEFNIKELNSKKYSGMGGTVKEDYIKSLVAKYSGYPPEIREALESGNGDAWIQLNPENVFVLQETKPMWAKYAVPFISSCLKPLAKKALISYYEDVQLNLGCKGFLHVRYGDEKGQEKVNQKQLDDTAIVFKNALTNFPLAVTNWKVQAQFLSVDNKNSLFERNKYAEVNAAILSAGGISSLVVSGQGDGNSSFAQATISVAVTAQRIKQNQNNFEEMMRKFNKKLAEMPGWRVGNEKIPEFKFNEIDLTNDGKFQDACFKLYQQGIIGIESLHEVYNFDHEQELERKKKENKEKYTDIFTLPPSFNNQTGDESSAGRPQQNQSNMKQDKNNSKTSAQPKPSNS